MSEYKNKVGRPEIKESDALALDEILASKEKREALLFQIKRIDTDLELHKQRSDAIRDDIKATAKDGFNLSVRKFKELVEAFSSGQLDDQIAVLTSTVDTLQVLKEDSESQDE